MVILQDRVHPQMGPSPEAPKSTDTKRNQFDPSKVKEKRVSYLLMETLKKITLQFMEVMVWMQCIKERMVV